MTDAREKITEIVTYGCHRGEQEGLIGEYEAADAIMKELPSIVGCMIKSLEWSGSNDDDGFIAESILGEFCVYFDEGHGWLCQIDGHDDRWVEYPSDDFGFETSELAKARANEHHKQQILKAMGMSK